MKKIMSLAILALAAVALNAQPHYKMSSNPDVLRPDGDAFPSRINIVLPQVNGYNVYKADLHIHTIYSDGHVSPEFRVIEAWNDGLDVLAITEHIEYRNLEKDMLEFMQGYVKKNAEAINWNIVSDPADGRGIQTDLDMSVRLAQKVAEKYGLTIIPGAEISRAPETTGHFNVLFTTDNDAIYHPDPLESMKNAKAQGALLIHNHPGWRRPSLDMIEFEKKIYPMGILDGIEVMNQLDFYPRALERAREYGLYVTSNTDMHTSTYEYYRLNGALRNMTLIFAKDKSLESLKEALKARRTLAYSFGTIAGEEQLLVDFFKASVSYQPVYVDANGVRTYELRNNSSFSYTLNFGTDPVLLEPLSVVRRTVEEGKDIKFEVLNMWYAKDAHPIIEIK